MAGHQPRRGRLSRARELEALSAIVLLGLFLRAFQLSSLPYGLHGDEAVAGLEGLRILREGSIGPYSPEALGYPAGPLYLTAISVALLGNTILAVRVVPMVLGTATILALYAVVRRGLGPRSALLAAAMLAIMQWHIHYARVGFPVEAWPLLTLLTVGALMEAAGRGSLLWWGLAGLAAGSGMYVYNAHPLFIGICGLFALGWLVMARRFSLVRRVVCLAVCGFAILVTAVPLILYASDPLNGYFNHFEATSLLHRAEWTSLASLPDRLELVARRYMRFWEMVCCRPLTDGTDGTGATPLVPIPMLVLIVTGMALPLARSGRPLTHFGFLVILLMPFGAVFTDGAAARRSFPMVPFLAVFAAIGLLQLWRLRSRLNPGLSRASAGVLGALVIAAVFQNLESYFIKFRDSEIHSFTFAPQYTEASEFMRDLPADSYVYFFSERWSVDYETRRFLAPLVAAEDRSTQFRRQSPGLQVDRSKGRPVLVLMGSYRSWLAEAQRMYPGGKVTRVGPANNLSFVAYSDF